MNNTQINFDNTTGQPTDQKINNVVAPQPMNTDPYPAGQPIIDNNTNNISIQQQMQNIPTVEQTKSEFINNTQSNNTIKEEIKNEKNNIIFIIILFTIILAAIIFLFPYLIKVL